MDSSEIIFVFYIARNEILTNVVSAFHCDTIPKSTSTSQQFREFHCCNAMTKKYLVIMILLMKLELHTAKAEVANIISSTLVAALRQQIVIKHNLKIEFIYLYPDSTRVYNINFHQNSHGAKEAQCTFKNHTYSKIQQYHQPHTLSDFLQFHSDYEKSASPNSHSLYILIDSHHKPPHFPPQDSRHHEFSERRDFVVLTPHRGHCVMQRLVHLLAILV